MRRSALGLFILFLLVLLCGCSAGTAAEIADDQPLLAFSLPQGIYRERFSLQMVCTDPQLEIRYTTNSSVPDAQSELYTDEGIDITYRGGGGTDPVTGDPLPYWTITTDDITPNF